ncbi:MAG: hypothetical protein RR413_11145 [Christensenellaceae bacterium]
MPKSIQRFVNISPKIARVWICIIFKIEKKIAAVWVIMQAQQIKMQKKIAEYTQKQLSLKEYAGPLTGGKK